MVKNIRHGEIALARKLTGLTQKKAARLVYTTERTWQNWEAGKRQMNLAAWELFHIKTAHLRSDKLDKTTEN